MSCLVSVSVGHSSFLKFAQIVGFVKVVRWIKLLHELVKIDMDFFKLLLEFVKIYVWISLLCYLSKKNKLRFDKDFRACWSFWLEFMVLKYSMHCNWVCSAFDKVLSSS